MVGVVLPDTFVRVYFGPLIYFSIKYVKIVSNMATKDAVKKPGASSVRIKNRLASLLHIVFNLAVALGAWGLIWLFPDTPAPAIALVALSKYRIFTVKPRYWVPNMLSGLVDFIFGVGIVLLLWVAHGWGMTFDAILYQIVLVAVYSVWLLWLKPNNKEWAIILQAGLNQFVGLVALFAVSSYLWAPLVVIFAFGIGFASSRHLFMIHKETQHDLLAMVWGLMVAQLAFLGYHWNIVYGFGLVKIPEVAIIVAIISFAAEKVYRSSRQNDGVIKQEDVLFPILFSAILLVIILVFFSGLFPAVKLV